MTGAAFTQSVQGQSSQARPVKPPSSTSGDEAQPAMQPSRSYPAWSKCTPSTVGTGTVIDEAQPATLTFTPAWPKSTPSIVETGTGLDEQSSASTSGVRPIPAPQKSPAPPPISSGVVQPAARCCCQPCRQARSAHKAMCCRPCAPSTLGTQGPPPGLIKSPAPAIPPKPKPPPPPLPRHSNGVAKSAETNRGSFWFDGRLYRGVAAPKPLFIPPADFYVWQPCLWTRCACINKCFRCVYDGARLCQNCIPAAPATDRLECDCGPGCCGMVRSDATDSNDEGSTFLPS